MPNKKMIGIIIDSLDGDYQKTITEELQRSAMSRDVKLLFFGGSLLEVAEEERTNNRTIFGLANTKILDGVIVVPSSVIHQYEKKALENILEGLFKRPLVSIGLNIDGAHSILLDNDQAMTEVIEHMMTHVNLDDICYISGPLLNNEARIRYEAWLHLLDENHLAFEPKHFYEGNFLDADGRRAVDYFIEANGCLPKAIVAANDGMAVGAYLRLTELGYNVPEDIGLSGFDNIGGSSDFFPAITTVDQGLDRICDDALDAVLQLVDGISLMGQSKHQGELVVRESCGCSVIPKRFITTPIAVSEDQLESSAAKGNVEDKLSGDYGRGLQELIRGYVLPSEANTDKVADVTKKLLTHLTRFIHAPSDQEPFVRTMNGLISYAIASEGKRSNLEKFIQVFEKFLDELTDHVTIKGQLMNIAYATENILHTGLRRREELDQYNFRSIHVMSRNVVRELNKAISNEEIFTILAKSLPHYGISHCYLVLYKRPMDFNGDKNFAYPLSADLVFGYENGTMVNQQNFITKNMLPTQMIYHSTHNNLLFLSVDSQKVQYGYMAFSTDGMDPTIYETIRSQISEVMKRHQFNFKRLEAERALKNVLRELELSNDLLRTQSVRDELSGLLNRRGFYIEAEAYYASAIKRNEPFWLIFGDIDGLKNINDTYGHDEGDYAIRTIASTLQLILGDQSIVARMSGDEFTALVMNVESREMVEDLVTMTNMKLSAINGSGVKAYDLSISLGYAPYDYVTLHSMDDLLRQADRHMYRTKARKRRT